MNELITDIMLIIINLLNFDDKITLYKTCKKYNFILKYIYNIPDKYHGKITDSQIKKLTNITELNISYHDKITDLGLKKINKYNRFKIGYL